MKSARLKYKPSDYASKLHLIVGEILRTHEIFKNLQSYQEYPVKRINPKFRSGRERFDWIIKDWSVVIECHGSWHFNKIPWGNREEAKTKLRKQKLRDEAKKQAALDAGWTYIALTYQEIEEGITGEQLFERIQDNRRLVSELPRENSGDRQISKSNSFSGSSETLQRVAQERKRKTREHRKQQYQRSKELRKQWTLKKQESDS